MKKTGGYLMAPEKPRNIDLGTHPLVAKLHPDPDDARNLISLVGYLGPSKNPDDIRLYLDLTFNHYYELPSASIVATAPTNADDPNSPTSVYVEASTQLNVVSTASQSVAAGFLKGAITSGYLGD